MNKKSNEEIINFWKSFESLLQNDEKFADQYLENRGYDPETEGSRIKNMVSKLIFKRKAEFAKNSLASTYERARNMLRKISRSTDNELKNIQSLINEKSASKYSLNFRDLKEMNEEEAIKILTDIEILELLEKESGLENDDSKS